MGPIYWFLGFVNFVHLRTISRLQKLKTYYDFVYIIFSVKYIFFWAKHDLVSHWVGPTLHAPYVISILFWILGLTSSFQPSFLPGGLANQKLSMYSIFS